MLLGSLGFSAGATTVLPQSPENLADSAPIAVHGRIVEIEVQSESGRRSAILEAIEIVRAPAEFRGLRDFSVPLLNRAVPRSDLIERVAGAPELRVGEELLAFLYPLSNAPTDARPRFGLAGFQQGKLRVIADGRGVRRLLTWQDEPERDLSPEELRRLTAAPGGRRSGGTLPPSVSPSLDLSKLRTLDSLLNRARAAGGR